MSHQQNNTPKHTNRLINETSPYLLQHAHNPVDWYAWGEEALAQAKAENKPIHLSVGYRACHWCHVMESESFEDEATAAIMNANFINIKVDREERPDIDSIYMAAVQAMTRHGGWPMTVFLTPDGAPFYGGTYFPPEPRHGLPSFTQVLHSVASAYRERPDDVTASAAQLRDHLREITDTQIPRTAINARLLNHAAESQMSQYDKRFGGYGNAPKFPQAMMLEMVLRHWHRSGDQTALNQIEHTVRAMANGGIYDQLGGGFARYSVDAYWLVPHFEKMLYDNALLSRLYLDVFQATGDPFFRRIAEETFTYILRDMTSPDGGFYASEDADSEGEEGTFYIWTPAEIRAALDTNQAELALRYWDVTERGNFEQRNILSVPRDVAVVAREFNLAPAELLQQLDEIRATLLDIRSQRERPARDEKILAAWNGMMLRAFALAARVLNRADYRQVAERNGDFLLTKLVVDGRLRRSYKDEQAKFNGYLEDYANVADGMLALYEATFERRWLDAAVNLAETMTDLFWDAERNTFFDTAADHEELVTRPRDVYDNATPSGMSVAVDVLLHLSLLLERPDFGQFAQAVLDDLSGGMAQVPGAFGRLLSAADFALSEPREIAIIGELDAPDTLALLAAVYTPYLPNKMVAGRAPTDDASAAAIPLLAERPTRDGAATAYVCIRHACQNPTTDAAELAAQLAA